MLEVGSKVFVFDENHRVYRRDVNGKAVGGCIYREFFREVEIIGETPRKWKTHYREAFKKNPYETGFFTREMVEDSVWENQYKFKIIERVRNTDAAILRLIAKIIGYEP